ncbi:MAG: acyl-CoA reductase [Bacteroidetes bacterium]|nr:acyl-CoA reductase [Bacteroidota bacterium]
MLAKRIDTLLQLKAYLLQNTEEWQQIKDLAERQNGWFTQEFIEFHTAAICDQYLSEAPLQKFGSQLLTAEQKNKSLSVGITMAGNIPMVGFHDFLCVYLSGYSQRIKYSSKDSVLMPHLVKKILELDSNNEALISESSMLKNCDAYIATGSNSSAIYFEKYFAKYPHIIRKNRTSVAILDGTETTKQLEDLADDVYMYFGLGCRNVSKILVPRAYDFVPLLTAFNKYDHLKNHNKYRNNYDYNLAIFILNNQYYMSNESLLLSENTSAFSSIAVLHFEYYDAMPVMKQSEEIQAIMGKDFIPFGSAQTPTLFDFADGISTIDFINSL